MSLRSILWAILDFQAEGLEITRALLPHLVFRCWFSFSGHGCSPACRWSESAARAGSEKVTWLPGGDCGKQSNSRERDVQLQKDWGIYLMCNSSVSVCSGVCLLVHWVCMSCNYTTFLGIWFHFYFSFIGCWLFRLLSTEKCQYMWCQMIM